MTDVFELEPHTRVIQGDSYILSYPHILSYFEEKVTFDGTDIVRGAHMVYGWMPTVLGLYPEPPNLSFADGAVLLTKAKREGSLTDAEVASLAKLINNSLVGASKLLHFVAPHQFAIWDSKIYAFVFGEKPYNYCVNQLTRYRNYLDMLSRIQEDPRFQALHESINMKIGYEVSPFRAIELVMFLNSPVFGSKFGTE